MKETMLAESNVTPQTLEILADTFTFASLILLKGLSRV